MAEWAVRCTHNSTLKESRLDHIVAEWYVRRGHIYWKNTAVAEWYIPHKHEVLQSALHVAMCAVMSEMQDRLQKKKERLQAIHVQPDDMVTFYKPYPLHLWREESSK